MSQGYALDLIALVAGKDEKEMLDGLLSKRIESLEIRKISFRILVHPRRDPGCFLEAQDILRQYLDTAAHALVIFDHEGSGRENQSAGSLACDLERRLSNNGWENRAQALVIEPELEAWVWSDSSEVDGVLGWRGRSPNLRDWLKNKGHWPDNSAKPPCPKETLTEALREARIIRSSAIYGQLAERVGLQRCEDKAFNQLKGILKAWFAREA